VIEWLRLHCAYAESYMSAASLNSNNDVGVTE